jgi:response regulator RpfG family c-di-GMP phosphodiesterase
MDCEMPEMDGFEATRRIRSSRHAKIPIIAVTADAMLEDRDRCLRAGMNDYLSKPVELARLAEALSRWLPACQGGGAAHPPGHRADRQAKAVFDVEALLLRLMGDRQLACAVLKGFLKDAPSQLESLRSRVAAADSPGVRSQAHTLKGASATVAAEGLRAIAIEMERAGAAGRIDQCGELLPRAVEEFQHFQSALESAGWV